MGWTREKRLIIDHTRVAGSCHVAFPVLVQLVDEELKHTSRGGLVAESHGEDLQFIADDGTTRLEHELEHYDPSTGGVKAWVRVPHLSGATDTVLILQYGDPGCEPRESREGVWDSHYRLVLHSEELPGEDESKTFHHSSSCNISDEITVEAWVNATEARTEALQSILSKWSPLTSLSTFDAYDAGATSGLDTTGFFGAVFDGRYVYFSPQHDLNTRHGKVLRYDTHHDFHDPQSWQGYDAGQTDGLNTKGYYGAAFDGRYVYFVPRRDPNGFHSRVLRYDTYGGFTETGGWEAYDAGLDRSYQSAAFDGRYLYFCPGHVAVHKSEVSEAKACASPAVTGMDPNYVLQGNSVVLRYDTRKAFKDPTSWASYDAAETNSLDTCDYDGACFDGRYVYFAPLSTGVVLRYDTQSEFENPQGWSAFDARHLRMKLCVGAVFDGRHVYFVPYGVSDRVLRYDTRGDFEEDASWIAYCTSNTACLTTTGFDGGVFDGRYLYLIPYFDGDSLFHGQVLRYDASKEFTDQRSWEACDAGNTSGLKTVGFNGGAFDGRFLYCAPWQDGSAFPEAILGNGRVLRYDTLGGQGSFSLRYCDLGHNGGLCAAVPGARFIVNTEKGALSIAANRPPESGRHYLAGTYDGETIKLYIDGVLVNAQTGSGKILVNDVEVCAGRIVNGLGQFKGEIEEARISDIARSADCIQTHCNNLRDPEGFCRSHSEGW